jgi:hypothetical protein
VFHPCQSVAKFYSPTKLKQSQMNEGVNEEKVNQDVLKAIAELREEEYKDSLKVKPIKCDGIPASELPIKDRS